MLEDASNQELMHAWREGNHLAAQVLVQRYMARLTAFARGRLSRKLSRRIDAEDVVLSAWRSFFVATGNGRIAAPGGDDLWPLLVTLTMRKLARQVARQTAQRRNVAVEATSHELDWQVIVARDPSPEEAALLADEVESLMAKLAHSDREVLTRRLQGEDQTVIATALNCSERTVRRALARIQDVATAHFKIANVSTDDSSLLAAFRQTRIHENLPTATTSENSLQSPTALYGDFVLHELVGQGGFGKVYRASRRSDGATVAVKSLKKRFWINRPAVASFVAETQQVSSLSHPNIIRHHGWGHSPRGAVFIVMDWVDGVSVFDWRKSCRLTLRDILHCALAVANALEATHAASIIHGDLTPNNILRREDGEFILTDFGFARSLNSPMPRRGGTPGFLAPEQVSNAFGQIKQRTDVYGLGGLLYALLTGNPPMQGSDVPEILANVISLKLPPSPGSFMEGIPKDLDALIVGCLSKEPSERPSSMVEVSESISRILVDLPTNDLDICIQ
jgi:RNA polymerase sigma factor (sigma-70 family)